jgi:hypothetical protein
MAMHAKESAVLRLTQYHTRTCQKKAEALRITGVGATKEAYHNGGADQGGGGGGFRRGGAGGGSGGYRSIGE